MQCQATTTSRRSYGNYLKWIGGGQCKRPAKFTDGTRCYCDQHAREPATVTRKRTRDLQAGMQPIEK